MARKAQDRAELERHLREQVRFLAASAGSFDAGFDGEARRLSTTLRILCHESGRSHALLFQLGLLSSMKFLSTGAPIDDRNLLSQAPLTLMKVGGGGAAYRPMLADLILPPRWQRFDRWWFKTRVILDGKRASFTRKSLVLALANTDGGAHVDPGLDEAYYGLSRENSMGWMHLKEGRVPQESAMPTGPELSSVRQIAHELYLTIAKHRPDLV